MLLGAFSVCFGDGRRKEEGLSPACGLSGRKRCVGQEGQRRSVVCREKRASGSRELSLACGLSGRKGRVGQEACRWYVVCRGEKGEWVKEIVAGVWPVGTKRASGSRELSLACGLSGQVWRVGQKACQRSVVCRREKGEWVKEIVASVWFVGVKRASGSKKLSLECGLSWRKGRVGQRNHTYRMPQTSQIITQIKIAKTLKT